MRKKFILAAGRLWRASLVAGLLVFWIAGSLLTFSALAQEEATSPGKSVRDALRERVEKRLSELQNKPHAFAGKITDIQNTSLLLETKAGTRQVKFSEKTAIVETKKGTKKTLQVKDLIIGNFIVAIGYLDTKDVLDARRILVVDNLPIATRRAVYGIVQSIEKSAIMIKHPKKDETWTIQTNDKTRVTEKLDTKVEKVMVKDIEVGDRIAAVGEPAKGETNTITARLIHVIPGKATGLLKSPKASPSPRPSPTP